jgi:serine/threonine-protein kinase HipA
MAGRQLDVWSNDRRIGTLSEADDLWRFDYDAQWKAAADGFSLSPTLSHQQATHIDGASDRPVQWYFDNLLPEEAMRNVLASEAKLPSEDAFGLLAYFGAESAGSLVLLPPGVPPSKEAGLRKLELKELNQRILNLPNSSLTKDAPKKMSVAGAQHKLLVVFQDGELYEPTASTPSTHILKPNHPSEDYAASVINEYFCMRLADTMGLDVPPVFRMYVPQPIYLIERFDRETDKNTGKIQRRHIIDTCQLLNKSRSFKYTSATLPALRRAVEQCRSKTATRVRLYRWIVFNFLIGNNDNHLKNLSFLESANDVDLASFYDMLSTQAWATKAMASEKATWPTEELTIPLGNAKTAEQATFDDLVAAGQELGLTTATCARELNVLVRDIPSAAEKLLKILEEESVALIAKSPEPDEARKHTAGELRLLRTIVSIIIADTTKFLAPPAST